MLLSATRLPLLRLRASRMLSSRLWRRPPLLLVLLLLPLLPQFRRTLAPLRLLRPPNSHPLPLLPISLPRLLKRAVFAWLPFRMVIKLPFCLVSTMSLRIHTSSIMLALKIFPLTFTPVLD